MKKQLVKYLFKVLGEEAYFEATLVERLDRLKAIMPHTNQDFKFEYHCIT